MGRLGGLVLLAVLAGLPRPAGAAMAGLRGDLDWHDPAPDFGGLSGLLMAEDGQSLVAVSDDGVVFRARLHRNAEGAVTAIDPAETLRLRDNRNRPVAGFHANAEALAPGPDGRVFIAFEGYARIAAFDLPDPKPRPMHPWKLFEAIWGNTGFEGLARLPDGRLLAVQELAEGGAYPVWLQGGRGFARIAGLPADGGYAATDAAIGPDGFLYLLERRQALPLRFATRVRRFHIAPDASGTPLWGVPETVLETPPGTLDNMEGLSLWRDVARGVTVMTLVSDNNFLPVQSTRLVEYDLRG